MYIPPFTVSSEAINLIAEISGQIERYAIRLEQEDGLRLRKVNRIKTIHSSLAIEGNKLSEDQVRDIIDGKNVVAPIKEIQEVRNAIKTYEMYPTLDAFRGAWSRADKKQAIIDEMKENDVLLDAVIEEVPKLKDYDYFDIICHLAYDMTPLTRKDRANRVRQSNYLEKYSESARKIIEGLMDKFGESGITEIENPLILKLDPFAKIAKRPVILTKFFKGQGDYNRAVRELEEELYKVG